MSIIDRNIAPAVPPQPNTPMLHFALDYAQRGWPVFPCNPIDKTPYTAHGFKDASTDALTVERWWTRWPNAMIGVPMGSRPGVWAVDPDAPKPPDNIDGRANWSGLKQGNGNHAPTHTHNTPGGGQHILFKWRADKSIRNSEGKLAGLGINVRGEGGYIIAPPSRTIEGREYSLAEPLDHFNFADAPEWLYDLILTKPEKANAASISQLALATVRPSSIKRTGRRAYGEAALRAETKTAATARHGDRNNALNTSSFNLGTLVGAGVLTESEVVSAMYDAAVASGLVASDGQAATMKTINSGLSSGIAQPREIPDRPWPKADDSSVVAEAQEIDNGTITQDGIARVFARRYAGRLRFCHDDSKWYEWTGTHWAKDRTALAFQFVRELGREFTEKATRPELKEVRKVSFAGGVEKFARSDRAFAVTSDNWDRDHYLMGTPAGTLDLHTGEIREPDPADGITKITAVAPGDKVDCPLWLKFLDETFDGDTALIRFLQQWAGYNLTGDIREHALLFGTGDGGNGKGVWLNIHTNILNDYATTATMESFIASSSDRHTTDIAMLRGARMVTASETERGRAWAEARIKQLTGGDPISARFMRQDNFTFKPNFKLTIIGNHKPVLRSVDDAARRRFNIVPFNRRPANPDPQLEQKLMAEALGIFRWMIDGCLDWQANGLVRPTSVIDATKNYFEEEDLLSQWLQDECDAEPGNNFKWESVARLFENWTNYCVSCGERPDSSKSFSTQLAKRGFERCKKQKVRSFSGLRLLRPPIIGGTD